MKLKSKGLFLINKKSLFYIFFVFIIMAWEFILFALPKSKV
jgi:hypothetical protein